MIKSCCRNSLKTRQLYQKLRVFHGQRQETPENKVNAVLRLQQNDTYNMLFVLRGNLVSWNSLELVEARLELVITSKVRFPNF